MQTPGVDAACHAHHIIHTLLTKPVRYIEAPHAVVAVDDKLATVGQPLDLGEPLRDRIHRDEFSAIDAAQVIFKLLTAVEEHDSFRRVELALHFENVDFNVSHFLSRIQLSLMLRLVTLLLLTLPLVALDPVWLATFDQVWQLVQDKHWDPAELERSGWTRLRAEYRPKVEAAKTTSEARGYMREMIQRLKLSHFHISGGESGGESGEEAVMFGDGRPPFDVAIIDGRAFAWRPEPSAGVHAGAEILAVGGVPLAGPLQRLAQSRTGAMLISRQRTLVLAKLSGDPGATVELTVQAPGGAAQNTSVKLLAPKGQLTRFGFLPPMPISIETKRLGDVGFIAFNLFLDPVRLSPAFESAVKGCKATCRGFVIDLRGNPGGIGILAMGLAGFFVTQPDQVLGNMIRRDSKLKFTVNPRAEIYTGPLAILIDAGTASTAEIMAGGLQDLGRARIFGSRSMGAALPSVIERLPNGDFFQYPVANYISRNGKTLEGEGVTPDQIVNLTPATLAAGDPVLDAALQWIHAQKSILPTHRK